MIAIEANHSTTRVSNDGQSYHHSVPIIGCHSITSVDTEVDDRLIHAPTRGDTVDVGVNDI